MSDPNTQRMIPKKASQRKLIVLGTGDHNDSILRFNHIEGTSHKDLLVINNSSQECNVQHRHESLLQ